MTALAYDAKGAADATGLSIDLIRRAMRSGDLPTRYPKIAGRAVAKPLILAADLAAWLQAAPAERAS